MHIPSFPLRSRPLAPSPFSGAWGRRFLLVLLGVVFSSALVAAEEPAADAVSKEYKLKAALLYTFAKYVQWPSKRFISPDSPLVIGVVGKNPFGDELDKVVKGRKVDGHPVVVKAIAKRAEIPAVHVLFVGAGAEPIVVGDTMDIIQAPGVLTVGETEQFTALGGVITFVTVNDKVNFEVSRPDADRGGLKLTDELLKVSTHGRKKI